jgi:N-acyl-D-aspartate/D-glutamate deacylase
MNRTTDVQNSTHWLLHGGTVIDGSGAPRYRADVRVENGRISEIAVGKHADLVVFDPDRIIDRATYAQPTVLADGIDSVMVNGRMTYDAQGVTGIRAGRFLRLGACS